MKSTRLLIAIPTAALLTACGTDGAPVSEAPATETVTVTETVTAEPSAETDETAEDSDEEDDSSEDAAEPTGEGSEGRGLVRRDVCLGGRVGGHRVEARGLFAG